LRSILVSAVRAAGARLLLGAAAGAVAVSSVPDDDRRARARVVARGALALRRARCARAAVRQGGALGVFHDRVLRARLDAVRGVERDADGSGEERIARPNLLEGVHREAARTFEPDLVARTLEGLEEREAVAGGAVTDVRALLVAVRAGAPDKLRSSEQKILVEVVGRADHDAGRARAPLQPDLAVRGP